MVARAQAYAMLELSQAGVLFLDREHKLMGEASAAAPELLGHTCGAGTAFVQAIAELVDVKVRREVVAYLESMWQADATATVDATQNPLARVHSGSRHLAIRFSRLVVDGRVHHIIVSIERIAAPRIVPHTIEVPALNEDTFARRLAGETGTRPALRADAVAAASSLETAAAGQPVVATPPAAARRCRLTCQPPPVTLVPSDNVSTAIRRSLDVTDDSLPGRAAATPAALPAIATPVLAADPATAESPARVAKSSCCHCRRSNPAARGATGSPEDRAAPGHHHHLDRDRAGRVAAHRAEPDPASIIDPPDARLSEVLKEVMHVEAARLENFLGEARDKAGQLRAILKLPAREPQAFREKLVLILELIRGIHARAKRLPLASVCERAERFEEALSSLRDKQDAVRQRLPAHRRETRRPAEPPRHPGRSGHAPARVARAERTVRTAVHRGHAALGHRDRHDDSPAAAQEGRAATARPSPAPASETQKAKRLSDLSQDSLEEMAQFLADMYSKRVSLVCVGLEDVPGSYRRVVEKILGQLIHNAIRHGVETPADRVVQDKPETRHRRRAIPARRSRRLSAQRAGRRPRSRPRQDPRRGRAPGRAERRRGRQHRPAQTRQPHLPARLHHRRRAARAASAWTWCATW